MVFDEKKSKCKSRWRRVDMDANGSHCWCVCDVYKLGYASTSLNLHIKRNVEMGIDNNNENSCIHSIFYYNAIWIGKITQLINTFNAAGVESTQMPQTHHTKEEKNRNELYISLCESNVSLAICRCAFRTNVNKLGMNMPFSLTDDYINIGLAFDR